jgi:hypothetical protein
MYLCDQLAWLGNPPSQQELFTGLQKDAQIWEILLWSSGGLLEIKKCKYYLLQRQFNASGQATMVTAAESNFPPFRLTEGNSGTHALVEQLDCKYSFRSLGIHKTISGDQTEQIRSLKKRVTISEKGS